MMSAVAIVKQQIATYASQLRTNVLSKERPYDNALRITYNSLSIIRLCKCTFSAAFHS